MRAAGYVSEEEYETDESGGSSLEEESEEEEDDEDEDEQVEQHRHHSHHTHGHQHATQTADAPGYTAPTPASGIQVAENGYAAEKKSAAGPSKGVDGEPAGLGRKLSRREEVSLPACVVPAR